MPIGSFEERTTPANGASFEESGAFKSKVVRLAQPERLGERRVEYKLALVFTNVE
jgi:hypothetical protein